MEKESVELEINTRAVEGVVTRGQNCLVGKLVSNQIVSKNIIISMLISGWRPSGNLSFKVLGDNIFLLDFKYIWDKERVMEGCLWVFEGSLFAMDEFDGITPPNKLDFEHAAFWVRMFNLPLACISQTVGSQIGSSMGMVEEVDMDEEGLGWGEYLRVRIKLDFTKPLPCGRLLKL